ncbi:hypothetical protein AC578_3271 [Pseudocercospora eumusae]|uniref:Uncharacterized protein n=1 Tax=Pseudocercospora eumusae TaxID=321146 RepID=A0A139GZG7_9PEZI|nr:hypothetical protein AC578_3271 [Pseudocercospora eumusae]
MSKSSKLNSACQPTKRNDFGDWSSTSAAPSLAIGVTPGAAKAKLPRIKNAPSDFMAEEKQISRCLVWFRLQNETATPRAASYTFELS